MPIEAVVAVLPYIAESPIATLRFPVRLLYNVVTPNAVLAAPVVLENNALAPSAVL